MCQVQNGSACGFGPDAFVYSSPETEGNGLSNGPVLTRWASATVLSQQHNECTGFLHRTAHDFPGLRWCAAWSGGSRMWFQAWGRLELKRAADMFFPQTSGSPPDHGGRPCLCIIRAVGDTVHHSPTMVPTVTINWTDMIEILLVRRAAEYHPLAHSSSQQSQSPIDFQTKPWLFTALVYRRELNFENCFFTEIKYLANFHYPANFNQIGLRWRFCLYRMSIVSDGRSQCVLWTSGPEKAVSQL